MKKKRLKPKSGYGFQVWWKPSLTHRSRRAYVLNEVKNFEKSAEFIVHKARARRITTIADYFADVQIKKLDLVGLVYKPEDLEKIQIVTLNNEANEAIKTLVLKLNNGHKWVIALHAWGENMYLALHQTCLFAQLGFNVLTFDIKGHGHSYGEEADFGFHSYKDLARIITYLKFNHQMNHYAIIGLSSGASAALRYLQEIGYEDQQLKFVISDSAFVNLDYVLQALCQNRYEIPWGQISQVVRDKFEDLFGFAPKAYNLSEELAMKRIAKVPVLFIHGEKDTQVNQSHAYKLYQKKIKPEKPRLSQLLIVPKANHKEAISKGIQVYITGVQNFLKSLKEIA